MGAIDLSIDSQRRLIELSRRTLEGFVRGRDRQPDKISDPYLRSSQYGAFVSLHKGTELRGCIGTCFPTHPLYRTVMEMTQAAASKDYRFDPISQGEIPDIHIEISVLSPLEPVHDPLSLKAGEHGVHVACGEKRGVLLPHVAVEFGWDMKTFLSQVCLKAALPEEAWKWLDTRISSFTALIIEERK